ncbi:hypothetical protein I6J39_16860 [Streptomyces californicus]|uniref:Uncharacterized protein n=1 Tax=Streptomyces californicus TaxID=67351 RepID=A0ABX7J2C3_9ACTN|nr:MULTISPECIES: hypothetical protein [Streptomyces]QRV28794.1 hypothetical protein I6J39_16860 [Streptomyces californicus]QRV42208.1 hypothetical protein I6J41_16775 [Streptomyces californicus]
MGFLSDRRAEAQAAIDNGRPEAAADTIVHAMLEGPGSLSDNLRDMAKSGDDKSK